MPTSRTNILLLLLGLILIGAIWYLLFSKEDVSSTVSASVVANEAEQTFIILTEQIDPVTFDTNILSDPRFLALEDLRTVIIPEPAGRNDPFAPLPGM